jgi:hypothetical protein
MNSLTLLPICYVDQSGGITATDTFQGAVSLMLGFQLSLTASVFLRPNRSQLVVKGRAP